MAELNYNPKKQFTKAFDTLSRCYSRGQVFSDFVEVAAIELWQPFYRDQKSEERYIQIMKSYSLEERKLFCELYSHVVMGLEHDGGDWLGEMYHALELHNKQQGQFFTPFPVSKIIAKIHMANREEIARHIVEHGFVTLGEPASGSGGMYRQLNEFRRILGILDSPEQKESRNKAMQELGMEVPKEVPPAKPDITIAPDGQLLFNF